MGTFGRTGMLATLYQLEGNEKVAEKFQLTESANVSKIMVNGDLWGSPYYIRGGIYSDENGEPKNLLGQTQSVTASGFGWIELPFTTPISLNAGWYWLTIHASSGFHITAMPGYPSAGVRRKRYDEYADGLESVWVGGESINYALTLYAVY
jgi:hypothetical protein